MFIREQAIGGGDIAQIESICNRLMIAKLLKDIKGEIPADYKFYKEASSDGGYYFYRYNEAADDFQQGIKLLGFGYVEITEICEGDFSNCMKIFLSPAFANKDLNEGFLFDSYYCSYDYLLTNKATYWELLYNDFMVMPGELLRELAKLGGFI